MDIGQKCAMIGTPNRGLIGCQIGGGEKIMEKKATTNGRETQESLPEELVIRPFQKGDRQAVEEFFDQMGGETRAFFDRNSGNKTTALRYFTEDPENVRYFLAEVNGLMVGYVFLFEMEKSVPWLGIAVREEYKGRHLGRKLMQYAENYAKAQGKGGILLTTHVSNIRGQGLYERSGYQRMGMHSSGEVLYLLRW